jgi:hypothetical protein
VLAAIISTNSTCPWPSLQDPDVYLDVPKLDIESVNLFVDDLTAKVSVSANIANLVNINIGVDAHVKQVNLSLTGVSAQLRLEARLEKIVQIINRTLNSLDANPTLLTNIIDLARNLTATLPNLVAQFTSTQGVVVQTIDSLGNVVQQVSNTAGVLLSQSVIGNYATLMQPLGSPTTLPGGVGNYLQQYTYAPFGTIVDIIFNAANQVLSAMVHKEISP